MERDKLDTARFRRYEAVLRINENEVKKLQKDAALAGGVLERLCKESSALSSQSRLFQEGAIETSEKLKRAKEVSIRDFRRKFDFLCGCYIMASHAGRSLAASEHKVADARVEHESILNKVAALNRREESLRMNLRMLKRMRRASQRSFEYSEVEDRCCVMRALPEGE